MFQDLNNNTICAPATSLGSGAISLVRVSGPDAVSIVSKVFSSPKGRDLNRMKGYSLCFGSIKKSDGAFLDDVVVSVFRAPASYTAEDMVEISCHASKYIVQEILSLLVENGARLAEPGEFTKRAFLNGKMDLAQAEAVADVISSETEACHAVAVQQLKGGFSAQLKQMRSRLLELVSLMELELDFSEEDVEFADRKELTASISATLDHIAALLSSFKLGNAIKNGVPVAIVGATNTGKSTLLNALLGEERAIVSNIAGTTRDSIEDTFNIGGTLFRFIDTAGIRDAEDVVEKMGIERTWNKVSQASVVLLMLDYTRRQDFAESIYALSKRLDKGEQSLIILLNKVDAEVVSSDGTADVDALSYDAMPSVGGMPIEEPSGVGTTTSSSQGNSCVGATGGVSAPAAHTEIPSSCTNMTSAAEAYSVDDVALSSDATSSAAETLSAAEASVWKQHAGPDGDMAVALDTIGRLAQNAHLAPKAILPISARCQTGLDALKSALKETQSNILHNSNSTLVTNLRHYTALKESHASLTAALESMGANLPTDLVAQDIRAALYSLGTIVGEISTDEVLGSIFGKFCIGK
ncbi:MAG: tRNA uridine-5-carboxymethylaminomethyl(34) synthesis GTPase MnmE [Bacteroidales bacterium]|nr:tRNA uridine-5-carboxymethylaminomethyl(34) synthesis GTPase MnmE [Bacteroidales bacterium]